MTENTRENSQIEAISETSEAFNIENYPKETYTTGKGEEKERYIVPDEIFEKYRNELPVGTVNASHSWRKAETGALYILGGDPERDKEVHKKGGEAIQATAKQRRTFKEEVDILLGNVDKKTGKTGLESITLAQYERALTGDTKAYQALRDTAGEKPAETIDLSADIMTDEDRKLMERINKRLGE